MIEVIGNEVKFSDGTMMTLIPYQAREIEESIKGNSEAKLRVKQALKLKDADFTGKEIIDIIGELE